MNALLGQTVRLGNSVTSRRGNELSAARAPVVAPRARGAVQTQCSLKELRDRISSVKNTKKITDAMKLVAAAKVRRAQDAVVSGRPFSENLVKVLYGVNTRLRGEPVEVPLCDVRPVKKVAVVAVSGDRGLCGGYNNFIIKKAEERLAELDALKVEYDLYTVGKKATQYFKRRSYNVVKSFDCGQTPTTADAQGLADEIFASFVAEDVDKVEMIYTRFVSLINSTPSVQTLLPLTPKGEVCDVNGVCIDAANDEVFKLTTKDGELAVEVDQRTVETPDMAASMIFEQEPENILDALLPLYLNSQILRALQEAVASELAARMNAMNNASDNARDLSKKLSLSYNRQRQAKITQEILEIVGGANA